jgi:hypothetical protein
MGGPRRQGTEGSPVRIWRVTVRVAPFMVGSCLALSVAPGCVAATSSPTLRAVIVNGPPPAPIAEELPPPAHAEAVRIPGYWHWTGIQYAWIPGHWEEAPPPGWTWRAPRYMSADGAYFYEPGRWWPMSSSAASPPQANAFH